MSGAIHTELFLFFYALKIGAVGAFSYNLLMIFRRVCRHKKGWVAGEDIAFWAIWTAYLFYLIYLKNNGILRWYMFLGVVLGIYFWQKLMGNHFVNFMSTLIKRCFSRFYNKKAVDDFT